MVGVKKRLAALLSLLALWGCTPGEGKVLRLRPQSDAGPSVHEGGARDDSDDGDGDGENDDGGASGDDGMTGVADGGALTPIGACRLVLGNGFVDQFNVPLADNPNWLIAHGNVPIVGERAAGGFVRDNVRIEDHKLVLTVHGDRYTGPVRGIGLDGRPRNTGARTGAAVATRDLFMSGTYSWEGRIEAPPGVKFVMVVQRDVPSDGMIAFAAPGLDGTTRSYAFGEAFILSPDGASVREQIRLPTPISNENNHGMRFDWYPAHDAADEPDVEFWKDTSGLQIITGYGPARAGRLWLVVFVPDGEPADFDTAEIWFETAFITPFGSSGDACTDGELNQGILTEP